MESLFIHTENQTVLWNLVHRSVYWSEFSKALVQTNSNPEQWFRHCIEMHYRKICSSRANTPELSKKEWLLVQNKEVLQTMTSEILALVRPLNSKFSPKASFPEKTIQPPVADKMYSTLEESPTLVYSSSRNYDIPPISAFDMEQERKAKYEKAKLEFEQYQTQYNRLLQPLTPPAPDFSETGSQSKIGNMEELLIIQQKMRETDYDMFSPPPPPPPDRENIRKEVEVGIEHSTTSRMKNENLLTTPMETGLHGFSGKKSQFEQIDMDKRSVSWSPALFT